MPAWGKGSKVIKRGRGRPKGSRNKAGGRTPHVPPAVESPDPFGEAVADPPQAAEAPPVAPTQRLGEDGARMLLGVVWNIWDNYASGIPGWLLLHRKAPELIPQAQAIWKLAPDERAALEPGLVRKLAEMEISPDDELILAVLMIGGAKLVATLALAGGNIPPDLASLLVPSAAKPPTQPPTVDTTASVTQ
jgi:hypothetical protein